MNPISEVLSAAETRRALSIVDLTDPGEGPHAIGLLVEQAMQALARAWRCHVWRVRSHPVVAVEDNYDRLGYPPEGPARDARYTRYVGDAQMLRSQTSAMVPAALRRLAAADGRTGPQDIVLVCAGIVYRRDIIDRLHTGEPHQLDLWRLRRGERLTELDLQAMIDAVAGALAPGRCYRTGPAMHPYTRCGMQIDIRDGERWVEIGECGLAHEAVLAREGLDDSWSGLAMGLGLDRLAMLRKGIDDIRLLRCDDPRVKKQMADLSTYRPVSRQPPIRRDISVAVSAALEPEQLGDRVRAALGPEAEQVEEVELIGDSGYDELPPQALARLGMRRGQRNLLIRIVLRDPVKSLTADEANRLRDRIYAALHQGDRSEWACVPSSVTAATSAAASGGG